MVEKTLEILDQLLQKYEVKGYRIRQDIDWCYGIDNEEGLWVVYVVDRGIRGCKKTYNSLYDACISFITQVVKDEKTKNCVLQEFLITAYPLDAA